jgi:hypothetical protein
MGLLGSAEYHVHSLRRGGAGVPIPGRIGQNARVVGCIGPGQPPRRLRRPYGSDGSHYQPRDPARRLKSASHVNYTTTCMVTLRLIGGLLSAAALVAQAQNAPQINQAYYDALQLRTLIKGGSVVPNWLDDHRFWFEDVAVAGPNTFIVDPTANTKAPYMPPGSSRPVTVPAPGIDSPDGRTIALLKDGNVWLRTTDAAPRAVTTDGTKEHFYGSVTSRSDALMLIPRHHDQGLIARALPVVTG